MRLDVSGGPRVLLGGGIGAGKSTVAEVFAQHGFSVIDADEVALSLMGPGTPTSVAVEQLWPLVVSGGIVDRQALARVVFSDADELRRLEAITHPAIAAEISRRVTEDAGSVLVEIPLLRLELVGDWYKVAVVADEEIRIARAVARGASVADVRGRVAAQPSEAEWAEWGDFVIDNGRAWAETLLAVEAAIGVCR